MTTVAAILKCTKMINKYNFSESDNLWFDTKNINLGIILAHLYWQPSLKMAAILNFSGASVYLVF